MANAWYETLSDQLPTVQGVTRVQLLYLPEPLRSAFRTMMQRQAKRWMALTQFAQILALEADSAIANQVVDLLCERGYLYALRDPETDIPCVGIRLGQKRGRDLPLMLKTLLQNLKALQLIEVNSDLGASMRGADQGSDALKTAALMFNRKLFDNYPTQVIESRQYDLTLAQLTPYAKGISAIYDVYGRIAQAVSHALTQGALPIVISGDHSTAGGTIAGIKMADPDCRLGVVWIDAHADIHSPYTTPSGNMHGMPLATALAEDNLAMAQNDLDATTADYWRKIQQLGGIYPKLRYEDLVYVAVRDTEAPEDELIAQHQIKNVSPKELRQKGTDQVVKEIWQRLERCDRIYISFDVDSLDPEMVSAATGTPVADGLTDREAGQLINQLIQSGKVCCFEICEINPHLGGRSNRMGQSAFTILEGVAIQMAGR
jgi:arginase